MHHFLTSSNSKNVSSSGNLHLELSLQNIKNELVFLIYISLRNCRSKFEIDIHRFF